MDGAKNRLHSLKQQVICYKPIIDFQENTFRKKFIKIFVNSLFVTQKTLSLLVITMKPYKNCKK